MADSEPLERIPRPTRTSPGRGAKGRYRRRRLGLREQGPGLCRQIPKESNRSFQITIVRGTPQGTDPDRTGSPEHGRGPFPGKVLRREPHEDSFIQEDLLEAPISESPAADPWKGLDSFNLSLSLGLPLAGRHGGHVRANARTIRRNPEDFPLRQVRSFLTRMIRGSSVWSRLEAYKLRLALLDERFVESALSDRSRLIQQSAEKVLAPSQERLF